jgi:hypothetical protein
MEAKVPNIIFNYILEDKIDAFKHSFCNTAKQTFIDPSGRMLHPGEYGSYREACCRDFLQYFVAQYLSIERGFIINTYNEVSTECDIIIYDRNNTPLIQSREMQKFYPVETVAAVGEIKSTLTKDMLRTALIKLSKVKALRHAPITSSFINRSSDEGYDPDNNPLDTIFTFLICEKFDFTLENISVEINNIYPQDTNPNYRHNLILSIKDGLFAYYYDEKNGSRLAVPYSVFYQKPQKTVFISSTDRDDHIKAFMSFVFSSLSKTVLIKPDMVSYLLTKEASSEFAI